MHIFPSKLTYQLFFPIKINAPNDLKVLPNLRNEKKIILSHRKHEKRKILSSSSWIMATAINSIKMFLNKQKTTNNFEILIIFKFFVLNYKI